MAASGAIPDRQLSSPKAERQLPGGPTLGERWPTAGKGWKTGIAPRALVKHALAMIGRFLVGLVLLGLISCSEQSYSAETMCGGRLADWKAPDDGIGELVFLQPVTITKQGGIRWNGKEISEITLERYLRIMKDFDPRPQMILRAENGADCGQVRAARAKIDSILNCRKSFVCGEGTGWKRWPGAKPEA